MGYSGDACDMDAPAFEIGGTDQHLAGGILQHQHGVLGHVIHVHLEPGFDQRIAGIPRCRSGRCGRDWHWRRHRRT
jgi:hypothetical protein